MARAHAGWIPSRLGQWRRSYGLSLEAAGERLRQVCEEHHLFMPAANFQTLWRHEHGEVYPGPQYRRAYCLMYGASEVELGFRPALPNETGTTATPADPGDPVQRRLFLRTAAAAASIAPGYLVGEPAASVRPGLLSDRECVTAVAMELWSRRVDQIATADLPREVVATLEPQLPQGHSVLRVDSAGRLYFGHRTLLDVFVGQALAAEIGAGRSLRLATAQTSHDTDQVIKDFVAEHPATAQILHRWLRDSPDPVLRVNSAGILAKLGDHAVGDQVIGMLRRDAETRHLYLTAVLARTLQADWRESSWLAAQLVGGRPVRVAGPSDRLGKAARTLAGELNNPRDTAARWCSAILLSRLRPFAPNRVTGALHDALQSEPSQETRRAIHRALISAPGQPAG